MRGLDF